MLNQSHVRMRLRSGALKHRPLPRALGIVLIVALTFLPWPERLISAFAQVVPTRVGRSYAASSYHLQVSLVADRLNPVALDGNSVSGKIYVFTAPDTDVDRVSFYLDDPNMTSRPRQIENNAPYDFGGGSVSAANPFDTTSVGEGIHSITAALELSTGTTEVIHATFTVDNVAGGDTTPPETIIDSGPSGTVNSSDASFTFSSNEVGVSFECSLDGAAFSACVSPAFYMGLTDATHTFAVRAIDAAGNVDASPASRSWTVDRSSGGSTTADQIHLAWVDDPSTTLTVVWRTLDIATPSVVEFRLVGATTWQQATGALRPSGTAGTLHEVTITSLTPSTSYEYRVQGDNGVWSDIFTTRTAPPPGPADFDAIYVADTGLVGRKDGLATGTQQVIDEIAALRPLLVLPGGDYAYYDTDTRYGSLDNTIDAWFNQMQPVATQSPLMPTYGNHEVLLGEDYQAWADRFPTPNGFDNRQNYSFDVGDVHFISILAVYSAAGLTSAQLQWLEEDILAAQAAGQRWIIPYFHVSPFADGSNHPSNVKLRGQLGPLFERLGVKLVLASHDQAYERTYPLTDVPSTNTPTSASTSCYSLADGVTWVKISPGGKLSNINKSFSDFATNPPPAWTAFRDNTMHHFARLVVAASGSIRLDTYGVKGDGSPPVIVDSFQYTISGCSPELEFGLNSLAFHVEEGTASQSVTLSTNDDSTANFTIGDDAVWLTVEPTNGVTPASLLATVDTTGLTPGVYRATVTATADGYTNAVLSVTLTVGTYAILVSTSPDRSTPATLEGSTVSGKIYVFTNPDTGVSQARFYLDDPNRIGSPRQTENNAPYDFAGGTVRTANPFDASKVEDGLHTITAALDLTTGTTEVIHATFTVGSGASTATVIDQASVDSIQLFLPGLQK